MDVPQATRVIRAGSVDLQDVIDALQTALDKMDEGISQVSMALDVINHDALSSGWELMNQLKDEIEPLITKTKQAKMGLLESIGEA